MVGSEQQLHFRQLFAIWRRWHPGLAERMRAARVDVTIDVFPEMQHVFQTMVGQVPEADDAIARVGAFLAARLGTHP